MTFPEVEAAIEAEVAALCVAHPDPSHDLAHVKRVVKLARSLASEEGADLAVVVPAAWLHDFHYVGKDDPRRAEASRLSADKALALLGRLGYEPILLPAIRHAIEAHSHSAKIPATTIEAQVVQDADRLDGVGAIGVARCFALSGLMKRDFFAASDPFCKTRAPDDRTNTLDHFFVKLLKVPDGLNTRSARVEGQRRLAFMRAYLAQLESEI